MTGRPGVPWVTAHRLEMVFGVRGTLQDGVVHVVASQQWPLWRTRVDRCVLHAADRSVVAVAT